MALSDDVDTMWIMVCGILVFFMQAGFSMLEAGTVRKMNMMNILFKNLMDAAIGAIAFWILGWGIAYGNGSGTNSFIGSDDFGLSKNAGGGYHNWFFQWAFAATAATIVSGAVAERVTLHSYFVYSFLLTAFIYPVVVHWVWDGQGWLSAFSGKCMLTGDCKKSNGMVDFAGSGVVHMVGGFSALCGSLAAGPRKGRFEPGWNHDPSNPLLIALGVAILWMGWYGFNCGSTLGVSGGLSALAGKVAVTTTIAAASGAITCMVFARIKAHVKKDQNLPHWDLILSLNGVLAGLVSITAGCATTDPWHAFVIGIVGGLVFIGSSALLKKFKIDDPLDACPIHGFCGAWGCLAVGIFSTDVKMAEGFGIHGSESYKSGNQFVVQLVGVLAILGWTVALSGLMFFIMRKIGMLRVEEKRELEGLDRSEHGGKAYIEDGEKMLSMIRIKERLKQIETKLGLGQHAQIDVKGETPPTGKGDEEDGMRGGLLDSSQQS